MRKLTIHFGNRPPIKRQGKMPLMQHNITPLSTKRNFQANRIHRKRDMLLTFKNPSTPTFLHPSKCQSP